LWPGPSRVVDAAAGGDVLEDEVAFVAKELVREAVGVAAGRRWENSVN